MTIYPIVRHQHAEVDLIRQMRAGNVTGVGTEDATAASVSWSTAWRLAVALSAILAVFGAALYHYLDVARPLLILFAGAVALVVGLRLPAVERPRAVGRSTA